MNSTLKVAVWILCLVVVSPVFARDAERVLWFRVNNHSKEKISIGIQKGGPDDKYWSCDAITSFPIELGGMKEVRCIKTEPLPPPKALPSESPPPNEHGGWAMLTIHKPGQSADGKVTVDFYIGFGIENPRIEPGNWPADISTTSNRNTEIIDVHD